MSHDVYLYDEAYKEKGSGIFVREKGQVSEISREEWDEKFPGREPVVADNDNGEEVYWRNITRNINLMADQAGLYEYLFRPWEKDIKQAGDLVKPLTNGLKVLQGRPDFFRQFNPANGWGSYEGLVDFVKTYLVACIKYPNARIEVSS